MSDSYVQVALDSSGKKIATQEMTRADGSTVVEVQETLSQAEVNDAPPVLMSGDLASLSLTSDGRLRVSVVQAPTHMEFFEQSSFSDGSNIWSVPNPWEI